MSESQPNIVVVVLDSVRFDRTSVGDQDRETTPNIERIADHSEGRSLDTAIAHARYTLPSSASILTGSAPGSHGIGFGSTSLDTTVPTVAEAFTAAGYETALVSNNHFVGPETGLDRGFATTTVLPNSPLGILKTVGISPVARWVGNIRRHSAGFETDKYRHSSAYLTTELINQQLDRLSAQSDPFFLYAHYNQTHRPYYPPLAWFDKYDDRFELSRHEAGDFSMDVHRNLVEKVANGCPFTDDEWETLRALYDAQLEYTDTFLGELFDRIQAMDEETIVVVTSDHGEHFGERGALGHKYVLDDALLRVPLVTAGLEIDPTDAPVQHTDLMRTLLEVANGPTEFVDGIDLRHETRPFAVSQDGPRSLEPLTEITPEFDASQFFPGAEGSLPARTSLRTRTHRYVRGADGTDALYQLPNEVDDRSDADPELLESLGAELDAWESTHEPINSDSGESDGELSAATKSRLMNMGYLEEEL